MLTSVACAIGPSVTTSSTDFFFFQNLVFFFGEFIWIFSKQKSLKNQYLPHFESQILPNKFPLNPGHRDLSNDNNNTKGTLQFFWKSSATTFTSNFQSRNHSIFKELLPSKSKLHETNQANCETTPTLVSITTTKDEWVKKVFSPVPLL
jgi:hypothetical protein